MIWAVVFLILIVALMIPILAIVLDAPVLRNLLESKHRVEPAQVAELGRKVSQLEDQVDDLGRAVEALKEENQFLHQLLENPSRTPPRHLPPPSK
jgi:outer membrane murein-binding lipoprotein Lpp